MTTATALRYSMSMSDALNEFDLLETLKPQIATAEDGAKLDEIEQEIFGRKNGVLSTLLRGLGTLNEDERKAQAQKLNALKQEFTELIE